MSSEDLYVMKSHDWWELIRFLMSAKKRGHLTESDLIQLFPEDERDNPSTGMIHIGAHILSLMELMGIDFLCSGTMKPFPLDDKPS